jgi:hypothetical protein
MADNLVSKSVIGKTNGKKSSEYWLSLLGTVGAIGITLAEVFVGSGNQWVMLAAAALGVFCPASYSASRAKVKAALMASEAVSEASRNVGKSQPSRDS